MKKFKPLILLILTLIFASQSFSNADSGIWTDWYRKSLVEGAKDLYNMRQWLDKHNLVDTNATLPTNYVCDPSREFARTADGSCNDKNQPAMGAAGIRFGRNIQLTDVHSPTDKEIFEPNPRLISLELLTRHQFKPVDFLNLLAASWIQFMIHDWLSHGDNEVTSPMWLDLPPNDPSGQSKMLVLRTKKDPKTRADLAAGIPQTYKNEVTHWWDGSQIYGSNQEIQNKLRSHQNGKLLVNPKFDGDRLTMDSNDGVEATGFKRNWWVGLSLLHQLFTLEHNAIAERLKKSYPEMTDQELFDKARLVNVAVMAKIHTVEWTPAILPNETLTAAMNINWFGLISHGGKHEDFLKKLGSKNAVLDGLVGGEKDLHEKPYSITEEFTSVYRLHSLLPETLQLLSSKTGKPLRNHLGQALAPVPLESIRDEKSHEITDHASPTDLFYSFGTQHPGALELNNFPHFMQNLEIKLPDGFKLLGIDTKLETIDMGTIDLIRDRERGVPRYNEFRRLIHLTPITKFEDLTDDSIVIAKLKRLYNNDVSKLDLMIGCLAEAPSHRPDHFGFGETQFQIFILMASRRLQADRFFTTDYNAQVYTQEGIDWVYKASFKSVLLRHFPGLRRHLEGIDNAFKPWK